MLEEKISHNLKAHRRMQKERRMTLKVNHNPILPMDPIQMVLTLKKTVLRRFRNRTLLHRNLNNKTTQLRQLTKRVRTLKFPIHHVMMRNQPQPPPQQQHFLL
ncbi:uncharacterized protein TM35_000571220 [Trypanosoma theileri]|uniref:Uncharacterized protein n=1 Tax=Trypanosoma theileri TaxID=67003 RepID=A0A1X0NG90_9TRYP|nr:uncharacterized protein TM35_000571220 [Trypanosoma theileri]ORC83794.1 hypothetical protein TM35_000571220 [Trypanosoma theileri]